MIHICTSLSRYLWLLHGRANFTCLPFPHERSPDGATSDWR